MRSKKKSLKKIGIMGGGFDPFHLGHLTSLLTVQENFQFQKMIVVPAFKPPFCKESPQAGAEHRLRMLKEALSPYPFIDIDHQEIKRKGKSYSYRTLENISKKHPGKELFFILGMDQFLIFDQWKHVERLLKKSNLIVTSRPHFQFPKTKKDIPKGLQKWIKKWTPSQIDLKTGKIIHFQTLKDKDISSSLVRGKIKKNKNVKPFLPQAVFQYIKKYRIYRIKELEFDLENFLNFCVQELEDKKAFHIKTFDLKSHSAPFLSGLIASSSNVQHSKSLFRHLQKRIHEQFKIYPRGKEGQSEGSWIVLDYNDVVIHIFYDYIRASYNLEKIWTSPSKSQIKESL